MESQTVDLIPTARRAVRPWRIGRNLSTHIAQVVTLVGVLAFATRVSGVTINVPAAYSAIQAGIDAASDGDIVLVADGVYSENISFNGKNIRVVSAGGASKCTINGGGVSEVVKLTNNETRSAVLEGFTLTNGYGYGADYPPRGCAATARRHPFL
jgi:hypothetical protein